MAKYPFEVQPRLSQIALATSPTGMIADQVCPRVPVPAELFMYTQLDSDVLFTEVDTHIGRKSAANQVEFGARDLPANTEDWGLEDFVPQKDIDVARAAGANFDPLSVATSGLSILISLSRERRVANLYQDLNNYEATLRTTLSGADQWSDHTDSTPITQILEVLDSMIVRPNVAVFNKRVWRFLRTHPEAVAMALNRTSGAGGMAAKGVLTKQAIADLLELDEIHVGETFANAAKKGQAASKVPLWGNHASFLRLSRNVQSVQGFVEPFFALTGEFGNRQTSTRREDGLGVKGGQVVKVVEQLKELIIAKEAGYHFHNAVAS
jgi:hypothetical protein